MNGFYTKSGHTYNDTTTPKFEHVPKGTNYLFDHDYLRPDDAHNPIEKIQLELQHLFLNAPNSFEKERESLKVINKMAATILWYHGIQEAGLSNGIRKIQTNAAEQLYHDAIYTTKRLRREFNKIYGPTHRGHVQETGRYNLKSTKDLCPTEWHPGEP